MPTISWPHIIPVILLIGSSIFMVIFFSWLIAFVEYTMAVPANRMGHSVYSAAELKTMQEVITLTVFVGFAAIYLKEPVTLRHLAGFALIAAGAALIFFRR